MAVATADVGGAYTADQTINLVYIHVMGLTLCQQATSATVQRRVIIPCPENASGN